MLVLHGGLVDDQFVVWAERSVDSEMSASAGKSSKKKVIQKHTVEGHPFSASAEVLTRVLSNAGCAIGPDAASRLLRIWLPTSADTPMPSTRLLCDEDFEFKAADKLSLWSVEAIFLGDMALLELVERLQGSKVLEPGIVLGNEFDFLCSLAKFAASMVVDQQYLPSIATTDDKHHARWQPLFSPQSHLGLRAVASAMPEVVRAFELEDKPIDSAPFELAKDYITRFVDQAARARSFDVVKYIVMSKGKYLSAHDCWLHSLCTADGVMNVDKKEMGQFLEQVKDWQRPLRSSEFSRFRLCFRLEEPRASTDESFETANDSQQNVVEFADRQWHVKYLMQDIKDPSLMLDAHDCWFNADVCENFSNADVHPREQLLRALGQAARLSEEIDKSLRDPTPTGYAISNAGAFNFLTKTAPALQQAGFSVLLPAWWQSGKPTQLNRKGLMVLDGQSASIMKLEDVVKFDWEVAIAGTNLSLAELRRLSALKSPLLNIRGRWVHVSEDELQASIKFLESKSKKKMTVGEVVQESFRGSGNDGADIEFDTNGILKELLTKLEQPDSMMQIPTPKEFAGTLRPYQQRGFSWLRYLAQWGFGACLADDMGLGKTIQTLALIQHLKTEKKSGPALLICPTSVVSNWRRETERFAPDLKVMIHHGVKRTGKDDFADEARKFDLVISTYGLLHRDVNRLTSLAWSGVIMDEAQNLKNEKTQQAQSAKSLIAGYRIALTGTPVENSLNDLHSLMEFLNPSTLGTSKDFFEAFLKPIQAENSEAARNRLKKLIQPFILRRLKTDKTIISDLPDKIESKVYCSLTKEQVSLYSAVYENLQERLATVATPKARLLVVMGGLARLKQVCNHPAHFLKDNSALEGRSGKFDRLMEMIEEVLQSPDKALIFTQFVEMGKLIKQHLQDKFGVEVLFLHGGLTRKQRDALVESFQSADGPRLFILSVKAGGTGLNLTAANHVFHFDRWWNPAVETQASDRAFRIGQTKNVQVHKFITSGTLEDKIDEMIDKKLKLATEIVSADEQWLAKMSTESLHEVLSLNEEALDQ